ncbi:MAG: hypothetical protein PHH83_01010 [Patescibacteria group bacterium]|nr:hypothetical protein [Patescibacteria group bacterium]
MKNIYDPNYCPICGQPMEIWRTTTGRAGRCRTNQCPARWELEGGSVESVIWDFGFTPPPQKMAYRHNLAVINGSYMRKTPYFAGIGTTFKSLQICDGSCVFNLWMDHCRSDKKFSYGITGYDKYEREEWSPYITLSIPTFRGQDELLVFVQGGLDDAFPFAEYKAQGCYCRRLFFIIEEIAGFLEIPEHLLPAMFLNKQVWTCVLIRWPKTAVEPSDEPSEDPIDPIEESSRELDAPEVVEILVKD